MNIFKRYYAKKMVKQIDKTIKVKFSNQLACEPENNTIYICNKTDKIDVETFKEFIKELDPKNTFNTLILGILHEVGHIYTFTDERQEEEYNNDLSLLEYLHRAKKIDDRQMNYFYLRLDLEKRATEWAIEFSKNNKAFCRYYQKKIGKEKIL